MTEKQMSTNNMAYTITGLNGCTNYSVTVEGEHRCGTSNFINVIQTMEGGLYSYCLPLHILRIMSYS